VPVGNQLGNSVTELNPSDGSWVRTPSGGTFGFGDPTFLAVCGGQIWVANSLANSLTVLPPG
jgi:hypothetical protein